MSFIGNEDHSITLEEASQLTRNFRDHAPSGSRRGGFFGKDALQSILDQEGCVGIRIYLGRSEDGKPDLLLVGVDADENDLIEGQLAEKAYPCPPYCGSSNTLNS